MSSEFTKQLSASFVKGVKGFTATITTDAVDRDGEVLVPQGCNSKDWERNPVLLWMHDMSRPVGRGVALRRMERSLEADFSFAPRPAGYEGEWHPDFARGMVESGAVSAVSVGATYMRHGVRQATQRDKDTYGRDCERVISHWSLHEVSLVSVPANQEALLTAIRKGYVTREQVRSFLAIDVPEEPSEATVAKRHVVSVRVPAVAPGDVGRIAADEIARVRGRVWPS